MTSTTQSEFGLPSIRKTPFIRRSLFILIILFGAMGIMFLRQSGWVDTNVTTEPFYPLAGLGILAVITAAWLAIEKTLHRPNDLTYPVRATSLIIFLLIVAGIASSYASGLHLKYGLVTTAMERLAIHAAQIFGWPLIALGLIFSVFGLVGMWRFLITFIVLSSIGVFSITGIFGLIFHFIWVGIAVAIAIFGGVVLLIQQFYNSNPKSLKWIWTGLLIGLMVWIPISVAIAKIQPPQKPAQLSSDLKFGCTAEQFTPYFAGEKPKDYIPGVLELQQGRVTQDSDAKLLSAVREAGIADAKIGKRVLFDPARPSSITTAIYLEIPPEKTIESACMLQAHNENQLFGKIELVTKTQLCQLSLKKDKEIAEYGQTLCDQHDPGWDKDYFEF